MYSYSTVTYLSSYYECKCWCFLQCGCMFKTLVKFQTVSSTNVTFVEGTKKEGEKIYITMRLWLPSAIWCIFMWLWLYVLRCPASLSASQHMFPAQYKQADIWGETVSDPSTCTTKYLFKDICHTLFVALWSHSNMCLTNMHCNKLL